MREDRKNRILLKTLILSAVLALGAAALTYGAEDSDGREKIKKIKIFIVHISKMGETRTFR